MADAPDESLRVEGLGPHHDRTSFVSGVEPLDRYFRSQAGQDARKNTAAPFGLALPEGAIGSYHTLSATGVKLADFPIDITRKLPRYPLVPATLLGRLAIDQNYQGRGYGRFLLADALFRAVRGEIASFAIIVDAKDEAARRFSERESFLQEQSCRRLAAPLFSGRARHRTETDWAERRIDVPVAVAAFRTPTAPTFTTNQFSFRSASKPKCHDS